MALATQLLLLTALRSGELREGCWSEIDFDNSLWNIPATRMKMCRPHVVPLSKQAVRLLRDIRDMTDMLDSPYIFPGIRDPNKPRHRKCLNDFLQKLGCHDQATAHGFRHTFSTIAHDNDFNSAWIELQLAHVDKNSIRGTYNHAQYLDGRREMMLWYADYVDELIKHQ